MRCVAAVTLPSPQPFGRRRRRQLRPRAFPYAPIIVSQWTDPAKTSENIAWARDCWGALQPFAGGVYVNDLGENDEEGREASLEGAHARMSLQENPGQRDLKSQNVKPRC